MCQKVKNFTETLDFSSAKSILVKKSERDSTEAATSTKAVAIAPIEQSDSSKMQVAKCMAKGSAVYETLVSMTPSMCKPNASLLVTRSTKNIIEPTTENKPVAIQLVHQDNYRRSSQVCSDMTRTIKEGIRALVPNSCQSRNKLKAIASDGTGTGTGTLDVIPAFSASDVQSNTTEEAESNPKQPTLLTSNTTPDPVILDDIQSHTTQSEAINVHSASSLSYQPITAMMPQLFPMDPGDQTMANSENGLKEIDHSYPAPEAVVPPPSQFVEDHYPLTNGSKEIKQTRESSLPLFSNKKTFTTFLQRFLPKWRKATATDKYLTAIKMAPKPINKILQPTTIPPPRKFRNSLKVQIPNKRANTYIVPLKEVVDRSGNSPSAYISSVAHRPQVPIKVLPSETNAGAIFPLRHVHRASIHGSKIGGGDKDQQSLGVKGTPGNDIGAVFPLRHVHRESIHGTLPVSNDTKLLPVTLLPNKSSEKIGATFPLKHYHRDSIHGTINIPNQKPVSAKHISKNLVGAPPPLRHVLQRRDIQSSQNPNQMSDKIIHFPLKHVHRNSIHGHPKMTANSNIGSPAAVVTLIPDPPPLPIVQKVNRNVAPQQPANTSTTGAHFPLRHIHRQSIHGKLPSPKGTKEIIPTPPPLPKAKINISSRPGKSIGSNVHNVGAIFPLRHVHRPSIHGQLTANKLNPVTQKGKVETEPNIPDPPPLPVAVVTTKKITPNFPVKTALTNGAPFPLKHVNRPSINGKNVNKFDNGNGKRAVPIVLKPENTAKQRRVVKPEQRPVAGQIVAAHLPLKHFHRESIHGKLPTKNAQNTEKNLKRLSVIRTAKVPLKNQHKESNDKEQRASVIKVSKPPQPTVDVQNNKIPIVLHEIPIPPPLPVVADPILKTKRNTSTTGSPLLRKHVYQPNDRIPKKRVSIALKPENIAKQRRVVRPEQRPVAGQIIAAHLPLKHFHRESIHGKLPEKSVHNVKGNSKLMSEIRTGKFPLKHYHRDSIHGYKFAVKPNVKAKQVRPPVLTPITVNKQKPGMNFRGGPRLPLPNALVGATLPLRHFHRESIHGKRHI